MQHALSFDVEEFFQVANLKENFPAEQWDQVPSRLDVGMEAILDCLARRETKATFFFLGWVAERRPDLVRACLEAGHEIASHGYEHKFLDELGEAGLEADLERTERALMAAGAESPIGFRASTFTLTRKTWWAFDVLVRRGYRYDSSVHPVRHPTYGVPGFEPGISVVRAGSGGIVEFPVATWPCFGRNWPVGGGATSGCCPWPSPVPRSPVSNDGDGQLRSTCTPGSSIPTSPSRRPRPASAFVII